jgi:hypothetical protein
MIRTLVRPSLADRGMVLLLVLLCASITLGSAGASLWIRSTADDLAAQLFEDALHDATQVTVTYTEVGSPRIPSDGAEAVERALPPVVREAVSAPRHAVVTSEMVPKLLPPEPGWPAFMRVGALTGLADHVELVAGRMPRPGSEQQQLPPETARSYAETIVPGERPPRTVQLVEVVLEVSAARGMEIPVGSYVGLAATSYDDMAVRPAVLHVVGSYRAAAPYPSPLDDIDTARKPAIDITPDSNLIRATALAADEATVLSATWETEPDLRWTFDPEGAPSLAAAETLVEQGRRVELQAWPPIVRAQDAGAVTGLGDIAATAVTQRDTSDGMALLGLTALAAGGFAVLLAAAVVLAGRRREQTTVVRARGASHRWLVAQRGAEALLIVAPGLVAAAVVVGVAGGQGLLGIDLLVAVVAALISAALVTAAQTVPSEREGGVLRLVLRDSLQLVVVVLTVMVTLVVWRRGTVDSGDPVTLLVAPLLGAAAAVVVLRLLQLLLAGLRAAAQRMRPMAPIVGLSQSLAISRQVLVATAAVVLALSSAVLCVALTDTLRQGAEQAGWEQVGADVTIQAAGLRDDVVERLEKLPGVESVASVFTSPSVSVDTAVGVEGARLVAFDPTAMREATAGSPEPIDLPASSEDELVALASPDFELDDPLTELRYAQATIPTRVAGRLERIPGVTEGESFLAVDIAALTALGERNLTSYDAILLSGSPDRDAVERIVHERSPQGVVRLRSEVTEQQLATPAVSRTTALLQAASVAAALVAGFAVIFLVGLGGPVRRRTSALLVAIGADLRQARWVSALGVVPLVAGACVAALGCGALLVVLADHGLELASLTATVAPLQVRPTAWSALTIALVCAVLVLVAAFAASRPPRQLDVADRLGTEHR